MQPHRIQHINEGRSGEHEGHHVGRQPARSEREDNTNCACRAESAADNSAERTFHRETVELALRGQTDYRNQHADQEVSNADAQERAHRIAAKSYLSAMQSRTIKSPGQRGAKSKKDPEH